MASNQSESASLTIPSGDSASRVAVDLRQWPSTRRLAVDYAFDFPSVAPFFAGDPQEPAAWADAIGRAQSHPRQRGAVTAILARQQDERGAPAAARAAACQLLDPATVAVVTGQQVGLFGGPLYTLLKALTAIKLAERVRAEHGVPAIAIFWLEAEDHDWDEVRGVSVFDEALALHDITLPARSDSERAGVVRLDDTVTVALNDLREQLAPTEFRDELLDTLRAAYVPGRRMAESFGRWLESVLGSRGLVVFDASDLAAKPIVAPIFVRELETAGATARAAGEAGAHMTAAGYPAQVQTQDGSVALFALQGGRRPIRRHDDRFEFGDAMLPASELAARAAADPAAFSPNVLLRPVIQDTLFPTICYVAGPNELAYLGQLKGVYRHFGVPMPLMYPRASATVVDRAALRFLGKPGITLEMLQPQDDSRLNQLLAAQMPPAVERAFDGATTTLESAMNALLAALPSVDPTLEGAARSTLSRMQNDLSTLHTKTIQAAKRRDETLRRQFDRTRALTFPGGQPQERAVGFVSLLNQYGPALIDRLEQELPLDLGRHWIVAI